VVSTSVVALLVDLVRHDGVEPSAGLAGVAGARGVANRALRRLRVREGGGAPALEAVLQPKVGVLIVVVGAQAEADLFAILCHGE